MADTIEFKEFKKIPRLSRDCVITEKIDGTNGCIYIAENCEPIVLQSGRKVPFLVGSRTRWIFPENDNHGFAKWAYENVNQLLILGKGFHYGEWWGQGIQRNYGMKEKRFSLFNTSRWLSRYNITIPLEYHEQYLQDIKQKTYNDKLEFCPECCDVVPILREGIFDTTDIEFTLTQLRLHGSYASPGFDNPEGIIIFHKAGNLIFKKTIEKDEEPKTKVKQ